MSPAEPPSAITYSITKARDHPGVRHFEGLRTGVYKSDSQFFVQSRDEFSNGANGMTREEAWKTMGIL